MRTPPSENAAVAAYRLMRDGRLAEALPFAQTAIRGAAECTAKHGMLASILCGLGRREDAESVVVSALQLGGSSADAYDALAHVSLSLGIDPAGRRRSVRAHDAL